ncbi:zinc-binding protein A33-like [Cheilinus undulatus]|uniref:zinc-binding protein A33-like n=1 Tax=Cheilinus undulatus TaxID=241271 RepID=UPI001BD4D85E|nr:zinc-binding protein A33-like [Cheilinus undulatus]
MTSACAFLSEEQFRCSICLEVFTDPVSIPCGHNFCKRCITHHWDVSDRCECPVCKTVSIRKPELHVNTFIAEMAAQFRRSSVKKTRKISVQRSFSEGTVLCDVCTNTKSRALKSCLMCMTSYCKTHLEPHYRIPGLKRHELIDPMENLEDRICQSHGQPLEKFCETDQMCICRRCISLDHQPHRIVTLEEEYQRQKDGLEEKEAEIQQNIQERQLTIKRMRESVKLSREDAELEKSNSVQVFSTLIQNVENDLAQLLVSIEEKQKKTEEEAEGFIAELEDDILELTKRSTEVEQLKYTEDHLLFLQNILSLNVPLPANKWTHVQVYSLYEGTMRRAVAQLEERLSREVKKLLKSELKKVQQYAVDVTLDPDTANSKLLLKNDGKQVSYHDFKQNIPDTPKRFSTCASVLGKQSCSAGKFYFEVLVKDKTKWEVGVARETINRKGHITLSPKNGFWAIWLRDGCDYRAGLSVHLSLKSKLEKVGVFIDYEGGIVSFYDVDAAMLMHSFTGCHFSGKLFPYFRPCNLDNGENSAPLIISTVSETKLNV